MIFNLLEAEGYFSILRSRQLWRLGGGGGGMAAGVGVVWALQRLE
jgi:hypothetical protein